jgi:uroporphyrinogen decarboxylase
MRQAGRYLPEYKKIKENYDFWTRVKTPKLASQITIEPIKTF